jgi:DNA-binding XRE family transcriptional regulator
MNLNQGKPMDSIEFKRLRKSLAKTQKQMAHLLGISLKAIHSYEQGWRKVPPAVERTLYFLVSRKAPRGSLAACWEIKSCSPDRKEKCPAWEFNSGDLCWFINGSICNGTTQKSWPEKMQICRQCEVFTDQVSF